MEENSFQINPDLAWRTIDGEVVVLKIKTTTYYSLDPIGTFIWTRMDGAPRTRAELVDAVVNEYDVDRDTATRDLEELLGDLTQEELLQPVAT